MQLPRWPGMEGELSENCLQNLRNNLMAESVCILLQLIPTNLNCRRLYLGELATFQGEMADFKGTVIQ